ncbi:MAG: DUF1080 domain-containing protein, partial [Planctomycetota bacterium]
MRAVVVPFLLLPSLDAQQPGNAAAPSANAPALAPKPLWNGRDLAGWHGQRHFDPYKLAAMAPDKRAAMRKEDVATMAAPWRVGGGA